MARRSSSEPRPFHRRSPTREMRQRFPHRLRRRDRGQLLRCPQTASTDDVCRGEGASGEVERPGPDRQTSNGAFGRRTVGPGVVCVRHRGTSKALIGAVDLRRSRSWAPSRMVEPMLRGLATPALPTDVAALRDVGGGRRGTPPSHAGFQEDRCRFSSTARSRRNCDDASKADQRSTSKRCRGPARRQPKHAYRHPRTRATPLRVLSVEESRPWISPHGGKTSATPPCDPARRPHGPNSPPARRAVPF